MGVADLRDAFNLVAQPAFTCVKATLGYSRANDTEWQILNFYGTAADGSPFQVQADRARASDDVLAVARATAQRMLDQRKSAHEPVALIPPPDGSPPAGDAGPSAAG